jgi:hypothetical protein
MCRSAKVAIAAEPVVGGTLGTRDLLPKPSEGKVTVGVGTDLVIDRDRRTRRRVNHPDGTGAIIDHPDHVDS